MALDLDVPRTDKRLLVFIETDGCGADGISVASGCWVGKRTLRVLDFGKLAATFVDTYTNQAVRVVPRPGIRETAWRYAPDAHNRWTAQLKGYRLMPEQALLRTMPVTLIENLEKFISRPGAIVVCEACREEILNEREVIIEEMVLCRACVGEAYYHRLPAPV
jgi:formylmethanofuran dehydrogenase subunit E